MSFGNLTFLGNNIIKMYEYLKSHAKPYYTITENVQSDTDSRPPSPLTGRRDEILSKIQTVGYTLENLKTRLAAEKQLLAREKMQSEIFSYPTDLDLSTFMSDYRNVYAPTQRASQPQPQRPHVTWSPILTIPQNSKVKSSDSSDFVNVYKNFISNNFEKMYREDYKKMKMHAKHSKNTSETNLDGDVVVTTKNDEGKSRRHQHHHRKHHHRHKSKGYDVKPQPSFVNLPSTSVVKKTILKSSSKYNANGSALQEGSHWYMGDL